MCLVLWRPLPCVEVKRVFRAGFPSSRFGRKTHDVRGFGKDNFRDSAASLKEISAHLTILFVGSILSPRHEQEYVIGVTGSARLEDMRSPEMRRSGLQEIEQRPRQNASPCPRFTREEPHDIFTVAHRGL